MQQKIREGWEPWRPGIRPALPGLASIIGHRGAMAYAPENTLAGFAKAFELGASWVEFDVKLTRDDVPVLLHDDLLDRTTDGRGPMAGMTFADLATIDAGSGFDPAFAGERIPSLNTAVGFLLEHGMGANVEIKPCLGCDAETGRAVARTLADLWPANGPPLLVSSFSRASLAAARSVAPHLAYGLLVERIPRDWAHQLTELGCTTLHPWYLPVRIEKMRALAAAGVPVLLYTVNDPVKATRLLDAGAAAIITDIPDRVLAATEGRAGLQPQT